MKWRRLLPGTAAATLAACLALAALAAQQPSTNDNLDTDRKILQEIKDQSEIMPNLEYLSDMIGPRLTGTDNIDRASHWTEQMFEKYGFSNVHLEPWTIHHAWIRGTAEAGIVSPAVHPITLAAAGWSPGTDGQVRRPVVCVGAKSEPELQQYRGKLKNAVVITLQPPQVPGPYQAPAQPEMGPYRPPFASPFGQRPGQPPFQFFQKENAFFKQEGVAAVLRDSNKPDGLMTMTGIGCRDFNIGPVPTAFITHEDYLLIWRLLQRGPVETGIEMKNTFGDQPKTVYNSVAELPGTDPNQMVIACGLRCEQ